MSTIVNLYIGGTTETPATTTYELVLEAPYTEPSPYLLVLRSAPDIAPITGVLATTEDTDTAYLEGIVAAPAEPISSRLIATNDNDVATLTAVNTPQSLTATLTTTENEDVAAFVGDGYVGIGVRRGPLISVEDSDTATLTSVYTEKWVAVLDATEDADTAYASAGFVEYTGPGFINVAENADVVSGLQVRQVYDVEAVLTTTESNDVATLIGLTNRQESEVIEDSLVISEVLTGVLISDSLRDTLVITEVLRDGNLTFADELVVSETLASQVALLGALQDTVQLTESFGAILHGPLEDSLVISETSAAMQLPASLVDTLQFSDVLGSQVASQGVLADALRFTEDLASTRYAEAVDTLVISETLGGLTATAAPALADSLEISETMADFITVYGLLEDDTALVIDEILTSQLVLVGVLSDTLIASDVLLGLAAETVHVVNAETGAVSTYTFTPAVQGMAQFRGTLYLATASGLYALDADQDEDGEIVWTLQTGFSNFGTDALKRIRDVNLQARTEGDTIMQVTSGRYGEKQEWHYRFPPSTRESYRDGVIKPGRGILSAYYALGLQGISPAEIDQLRVTFELLSRRR
jgi:hypothetical protein